MIDFTMQYVAGTLVSYILGEQARVSVGNEGPPIQIEPRPGHAPPGARSLGCFLQGVGDRLCSDGVAVDMRDPQCRALRRLLARAGYRDEWTPEELLADDRVRRLVGWLRGEGRSGLDVPG